MGAGGRLEQALASCSPRRRSPAPVNLDKLPRDAAEAARRYPPGSVGAAFQVYIRTPEWDARAPLTRNKIWWPAWFRIRDMWGDVAPDTITFEMMSKWRAALEKKYGRDVAHKTIRVWRSFWKIMLGMKVAHTADPSTGIRNRAPPPRWQRWTEGEAVRLVKTAWRSGYHGLACIKLSPGIRHSRRWTCAPLPRGTARYPADA
jgi:hypothetical protein